MALGGHAPESSCSAGKADSKHLLRMGRGQTIDRRREEETARLGQPLTVPSRQ